MDGQIHLNDIYPEKVKYTEKSCGATWEPCEHKMGICAETCCQNCDIPCSQRCRYSKGQKKVCVGKKWVANPDYREC